MPTPTLSAVVESPRPGVSEAVLEIEAQHRRNLEAIAAGTLPLHGPQDGQLATPPQLTPEQRASLEALLVAIAAAAEALKMIDADYPQSSDDAADLAWRAVWALGRDPNAAA
ncbi:hypothetical protein C7293_13715 [filamentous cyanobacterium CCT1]|nr:hypothetical protein C7293_13715 [filamentous cyanobacterium CCT1]PSN80404.1 hypothetical protein C8B47_06770 [filamentous cyanobacterium CCP4]